MQGLKVLALGDCCDTGEEGFKDFLLGLHHPWAEMECADLAQPGP